MIQMARFIGLFFLGIIFTSISASAFALGSTDCRVTDQKSIEGTVCITSRGFEFIRIKNLKGVLGWEDKTQAVVWYDDKFERTVDQGAALNFCEKVPGRRLPLIGDFELAEQHGFREILRDLAHDPNDYPKGFYYWSSSRKGNQWYLMRGETGGCDYLIYSVAPVNFGAVCLSYRL